MSKERYTIEVSDEFIKITGTLSIREAFDFLNFFDREGYGILEGDEYGTTICMRKGSLEEERKAVLQKELLEEMEKTEIDFNAQKKITEQLTVEILDLKSLIHKLSSEHETKTKKLNKRIEDLQKEKSLLKLKFNQNYQEQRSLSEAQEEQKVKYKTYGNTKNDFYERQRVKVICLSQDFHFFNGEFGTITQIKHDYQDLCIRVEFDHPRLYEPRNPGEEPWKMDHFYFDPEDLCPEDKAKEIDAKLPDVEECLKGKKK